MIRLVLAVFALFLVLGCNSGKPNVQSAGGVRFHLKTVPDPPKPGRIQLELYSTKDGKPWHDYAIDMVISDVSRTGGTRDVYLNLHGDKLVGLVDVYPGRWKVEIYFNDAKQEYKAEFYLTVSE